MATSKKPPKPSHIQGLTITNPAASARKLPRGYHVLDQPQVVSGQASASVPPVTVKSRSSAKPGEIFRPSKHVSVTGPDRTQLPKKGSY